MKAWNINSNDLIVRCEQTIQQQQDNIVTVCIFVAGKYSRANYTMLMLQSQKQIDSIVLGLLKNLVDSL